MIAMHAERCEDPAETRWVCDDERFAGTGVVRDFGVDTPLTRAISSARVDSEHTVRVRLRDGLDWRSLSGDVWADMSELIGHHERWQVEAEAASSSDARLSSVVARVLGGDFGDFVASHGGTITLRSVHDGVVTVALSGACAHCAAAAWTLRMRLERDIRVAAGDDFRQLIAG